MTSGTRARLAALLALLALAAGCGTGTDQAREAPPATAPDELGAHGGEPCPDRLPGDEPFGPEDPADASPSLSEPELAWVCRYTLDDDTWTQDGEPVPVAEDDLPAITHGLDGLEPGKRHRMCTADLGPRWLLVWADGTDLTGATLDDFGCRVVLLTDEPHETVPGEATESGTVPGALVAQGDLLAAVKAAYDG